MAESITEVSQHVEETNEQLTPISMKSYENEPYTLSFKNITYKIPRGKKKPDKIILDNISGTFKSGKLTAILGPSGAGKSTLVKILVGYLNKAVTGQVLINDSERTYEDRWKISCISQECSLLSNLTTKETLQVAADLKIPVTTTHQQKETIISDIAETLSLQKCMDFKVGKLSGGEKKRLSIGVELVTNPPIMFFDEPTSGLDSVSSIQVISHLKKAALSGRTIICVIHQPSSKIFSMFDDMVLMSEGKIIYGGPVSDMVPAFKTAGFVCPQHYNRADYALEVASLEANGDMNCLIENAKNENSIHIASHEEDEVLEVVQTSGNDNIEMKSSKCDSKRSPRHVAVRCDYAVSGWRQFIVLLNRSSKCNLRDVYLTYSRIGLHIGMGLWLGMFYYQIGNDAAKIMSNSAYLYFLLLFIYCANTMPTILTFPSEAAVFHRELLNNWYSLPGYYFSKVLSDIPVQVLCPTVLLMISLVMTAQPLGLWRVFMVWICCIIFTALSQATALVASAAFKLEMVVFVLSSINTLVFVFSGFFIKFHELSSFMYALSYISYVGFGYDAIAQAIYGYNRPNLQCSAKYCQFIRPEKFLNEIGLRGSMTHDFIVLVTFLIVLHCLLYLILYFKVRKARHS